VTLVAVCTEAGRPESMTDEQLAKIEHVVVLMLENRSFDHMLGFLYADEGNVSPAGDPFEGLTGTESNPDSSGNAVTSMADSVRVSRDVTLALPWLLKPVQPLVVNQFRRARERTLLALKAFFETN